MKKYLYHGSNSLIEGPIKPAVSFHCVPYVYATDDYLYALVRAGKFNFEKCLIREDYRGDSYSLCELKRGAFKKVFDRPGYVYIFNNKNKFICIGDEYVCPDQVEYDSFIYIPNVWEEMQRHLDFYKLIKYTDDQTEYWSHVTGGREGYLARRKFAIKRIKAVKKALKRRIK